MTHFLQSFSNYEVSKTWCAGLESTLFGQQRVVPGTGLLLSTAGKNGLRRSSPTLHTAASPLSSHKADIIRDSRHESETRARHQSSLHHSATSSRDQLVEVMLIFSVFHISPCNS